MRDTEDGETRFSRGCVEEPCNVERFSLAPGGETGRGEQVVQRDDQTVALAGGKKLPDREHADFVEGRLLHRGDQAGEVGGLAVFPGLMEDGGEQAEFAALQGVGIDAEEAEQAGGCALDPLGEEFGVVGHFGGRRLERSQDGERDPRVAARRVNGDLALFAQGRNALRRLAPLRKAVLPFFRLGSREFGGRDPGFAGIFLIDPRNKVLARHVGKGEQKIAQVSLRVDDECRNAIHGGLFQKGKAKTRFAAASHADAHPVGGQVARIIKQRRIAGLTVRTDLSAEVKKPQLFVNVGRHGPKLNATHRGWREPSGGRVPGGGRCGNDNWGRHDPANKVRPVTLSRGPRRVPFPGRDPGRERPAKACRFSLAAP